MKKKSPRFLSLCLPSISLLSFFLLLLNLVSFSIAHAQSPQALNYSESVVRDNSGKIIVNQLVSVRITVLDDSTSGTILYRETHSVTTNQFGLITLPIGMGTALSGTFSGISWGSGLKYLEVEIDPAGGSNYANMGTTQLLSVPYALYAQSAGNSIGSTGPTGPAGLNR